MDSIDTPTPLPTAFAPEDAALRPRPRSGDAIRTRDTLSSAPRAALGRWLRVAWNRLPALLPVLAFLPLVLSPPLNHDVSAVLQFSQRWLGGEHMYSDLIDVNPPLIYVLNLLPAALAAVTPLDAITALQLCILAYGAFCWWLSLRVRDRAAEGGVQRALLDVLPLMFVLGAGYDFGQREHLMSIGALPYLLHAAQRARLGRARGQPRHAIAIGVVAGFAFALKPHFLGIPALVELALLLTSGLAALRDRTPWVMAAVWVVYIASLPLVFHDYLYSVLPLVWDFYLDEGGLTPLEVLLTPRLATALCVMVPAVLLALAPAAGESLFSRSLFRRATRRYALSLPRLFVLAGLGALASAMVQHKGYSYHIVPVELFALAVSSVLIARWLDNLRVAWPDSTPQRIAGLLLACFTLYSFSNGEAPWKQLDFPQSDVATLTANLEKFGGQGERVLVLSPGIWPIFPALNYAHAQLTLRTMNTWLLQGAYAECLPDGRRYREIWEMGRPEFFVFRTVAEDFARNPPALVLQDMDPGISWCGSQFDYIAYFSRHPLFREVFSHYKLVAEWDRYRLFARKD